MERRYKLSHGIRPGEAEKIEEGLRGVEGFRALKFDEDGSVVEIEAEDKDYPEVMTAAVNIFRRVSSGCELRYLFWAHKMV